MAVKMVSLTFLMFFIFRHLKLLVGESLLLEKLPLVLDKVAELLIEVLLGSIAATPLLILLEHLRQCFL